LRLVGHLARSVLAAVWAAPIDGILDDALEKMVGEVTSPDPGCRTINELIKKYDTQPWEKGSTATR
jgi:hypothetical protein